MLASMPGYMLCCCVITPDDAMPFYAISLLRYAAYAAMAAPALFDMPAPC